MAKSNFKRGQGSNSDSGKRSGERSFGKKKPFSKQDSERRSGGDSYKKNDRFKKRDDNSDDRKSFSEKPKRFSGSDSGERSYGNKEGFKKRGSNDFKRKRSTDSRTSKDNNKSEKPFSKFRKDEKPAFNKGGKGFKEKRPFKGKEDDRFEKITEKYSKRLKHDDLAEGKGFRGHAKDKEEFKERKFEKRNSFAKKINKTAADEGLIRLNKYLANAGISSRREADTLIQSGTVKVNGVVVDQLGYKVKPTDVVTYGDAPVRNERKVYLLLNKPKDFITTMDDPQERRTVMELIKPACKERVYPVGRLDRNTTGLLLFTNDGELATKLMHPKHEIKKVYHVTLSKGLKTEDYKAIAEGLELEDGPVKVDDIAYVGEGKKDVGLEIHSGRNRIVRRIFEHLGYDVIKLDRVSYAGLTKKDLPRGKYRFLTEKEVAFLKMLG